MKCKWYGLLAGCVLGDGLRSFAYGVFCKLSWKKQTNSRLNFSRSDRGAFVVVSETAGLGGDTLKDIVDEAIHDGHGLAGDTSVRVNLLEHLVDVDRVSLATTTVTLLFVNIRLDRLLGLARRHMRLLGLWSHDKSSSKLQ